MQIGDICPKGRVQDRDYNPSLPVVDRIIAEGKVGVQALIGCLTDETAVEGSWINYRTNVQVRDLASQILNDLFLDPTWTKASVREICDLKGAAPSELAIGWRKVWERYADRMVWNEDARFFDVKGVDLVACAARK